MLGRPRKHAVALLGTPGVGKSAVLKSAGFTGIDDQQPTVGMQYTFEYGVRLPGRSARTVIVRVCEHGASGPRHTKYTRDQIGRDAAVGLVFSAHDRASYANLWTHYREQVAVRTEASHMMPFVFVVETHCEDLDAATLSRHRRATETDLYRAFGAAFLFFQLDARARSETSEMWRQVATQLERQDPRSAARIRGTSVQEMAPDEGCLWRMWEYVAATPTTRTEPLDEGFVFI